MWLNRIAGVMMAVLVSHQVDANETTLLNRWTLAPGHYPFVQQKWIKGLQRPLRSSGYLALNEQSLEWVTEKPVLQKVHLDAHGVTLQHQQVQAGSELIGQLMLAVVQHDTSFLAKHFSISKLQAGCLKMQPKAAPLNKFYQQIQLCGETKLEQIELIEVKGNRSLIQLQGPEA
ncbi:MAG: outer membrane lipoprotein carrier protein LolA [Rheinheimera sp.]|nr:MAG: outer membrane lipoprotein carrier protein LolA [Rheinheimera sp.]